MKNESVIKDIFHGFMGHIETMQMPKEHFKNGKKLCDIQEELQGTFSPAMWELHRRLVDLFEENYTEEVDFYFVEGFKLGLLMGIECPEK